MKKLFAFARAVAIIVVAILPGFGAAFTMVAGAPEERPPEPPKPTTQSARTREGR